MAGCCEHGDEHSVSINAEKLLAIQEGVCSM